MRKEPPNLKARQAIIEVLDNQLTANDPPETKQTLQRLMTSGIDEQEARRLIACVIAAEVFVILKEKTPFDRDRFITRLHSLPDTSFLSE